MSYNMSNRYKCNSANRNAVQSEYRYIANLSYDVNPAMRLGVEWDHFGTTYANYGAAIRGSGGALYADKKGTMNTVRIGAWYFF